jgi:hypothetical protein
MIASVDSALVTIAARALRQASNRATNASAVENCGGKLRAVDQREALLGAERYRRDAGRAHRLPTGHFPAVEHGAALADHYSRHVREWRQITGCADRSLRRDHRHQLRSDHRFKTLDQRPAHPGCAAPERHQLQHHHQAHDRCGDRIADPATVRENEIALQSRGVLAGNLHAGEFAEAGVDAVPRVVSDTALGIRICTGSAGFMAAVRTGAHAMN